MSGFLKKILVATHNRKTSKDAFKYALRLGQKHDAVIYALHVVDVGFFEQEVRYALVESLFMTEKQRMDKGKKETEAFITENMELDKGVKLEMIVKKGKPFVEIIKTAKQKDADIIVIGAHSRHGIPHGITHGFMGSVAEKVFRKSHCPVLTVKPLPYEKPGFLKKILVPVDFSECSGTAMKFAAGLAEANNSIIYAMNVIDEKYFMFQIDESERDIHTTREKIQEGLEKERADGLKNFIKTHLNKKIKTETIVKIGKPAEKIVSSAAELEADMMVMGTHGGTVLTHTLVGSVTDKVVHSASCPVMTIRAEGFKFKMP